MSKFPIFLRHQYEINGLDLSDNEINGTIPHWAWETWNYISLLGLSGNRFTSVGYDPLLPLQVDLLDLSNNMLEGSIPIPRGSSTSLKYSNNGFSSMPSNFSAHLRDVTFFMADGNEISGNIPLEFCSAKNQWFKKLKSMMIGYSNTSLVMDHEVPRVGRYKFSTTITYKGSAVTLTKILRTFVFIDVSENKFHGSIPGTIGELILLHALNMSHNFLTGPIPSQLGHLNQLEALDMSSNELSGVIPQELASLDFLAILNLSYNKLDGRIPQSPHFSTFSSISFLGNKGLCGPPLSTGCSNTTSLNVIPSEKNPVDIVLFLSAGLGFGLGFAIAIVVAWGIPIRKRSTVRQRAL
ncbi:receptor-like protein 9DC3 [Oryza glaberrima]|uniref:receptor-like protein 9DC3 n=1 Tax=Oryza glaberrima TaxID=4538 RepID=UPI00224BEE72|nr:receptor-like protein 9DC3 [Oryza glaberrima]